MTLCSKLSRVLESNSKSSRCRQFESDGVLPFHTLSGAASLFLQKHTFYLSSEAITYGTNTQQIRLNKRSDSHRVLYAALFRFFCRFLRLFTKPNGFLFDSLLPLINKVMPSDFKQNFHKSMIFYTLYRNIFQNIDLCIFIFNFNREIFIFW